MELKKKVLIVEDNANARELIVLVIKQAGYDVVEASTGLEAVDQAHALHPDLILMDLGLPGINGDEATERIKADPSTRNIPVIVTTAFPRQSSQVQRAIAAGAAEIVYKPVNSTALAEMVQRYSSRDAQTHYYHQTPTSYPR
jgi:CheY-like chemotaxis protein